MVCLCADSSWCDKCMGEAGSTWKGELGSDDEEYSVGEWELLKQPTCIGVRICPDMKKKKS